VNVYKIGSETYRRRRFIDMMLSNTLLRQIVLQCLHDTPVERPEATYICKELKDYLEQLTTETVNYYNEDKLSLLEMLETFQKVKQHLTLENESVVRQLNETKKELEEKESVVDNISKEKKNLVFENKSLQEKLTEQDQELVTTCQNEVQRLREDLKEKQEELKATSQSCDEMKREIQDLKTKLEIEKQNTEAKD